MNLNSVLQSIADSGAEVSVAIRDEWDCGWQVRLDEVMEPLTADLEGVAHWLHAQMLERYPLSRYTDRLTELSSTASTKSLDLNELLEALYNNEHRVGLRLVAGHGWDITFNRTTRRFGSLCAAAQWLNRVREDSASLNVDELT